MSEIVKDSLYREQFIQSMSQFETHSSKTQEETKMKELYKKPL